MTDKDDEFLGRMKEKLDPRDYERLLRSMGKSEGVDFVLRNVYHSKNPGDMPFYVVRFIEEVSRIGRRTESFAFVAIVFEQKGTLVLLHEIKDEHGDPVNLEFEGNRLYEEPLRMMIEQAREAGKVEDIPITSYPIEEN